MTVNIHRYSENLLVKTGFDGALANSTQSGTAIDTWGLPQGPYRRAALVVHTFTGVGTTVNFKLQDSPDNSTWSDVTGATLGSAIAASTADTDPYVVNIDLAKRARYLRAQIIGTGTAGNAVAQFVFYGGENAAPAQTQTAISV